MGTIGPRQFHRRYGFVTCAAMAAVLAVLAPHEASAQPVPDDNHVAHCDFVDPIYNIPRIWGFMAAFDFDERSVTPAVIDIGLTDDGSVRPGNEFCDVTYRPSQFWDANFSCGTGVGGPYDGILPGRMRHGDNMKRIIAETLNDGSRAGIAGQVAAPNLYRFDEVHNYLFELDTAINRAVNAGSTSINISGGFPCRWKPEISPVSTFDICTIEGRTATTAAICLAPPIPGGPPNLAQIALCAAGTGSVFAEGDIRDRIAGAAIRAHASGVPIVASAGNVVDGLVGTLTNAEAPNADTVDWGILPATVGVVITAGSVGPNPPYANFDFHGPDVDIWAPDTDTSPAAAFVSGLIAVAQAINPELNPATATFVPGIPDRLRDHLVDTAYTNGELNAAGHVDPLGLRRNLVNPYRFVRAVSDGLVPDYRALGYAEHFDSGVAASLAGNDGRPTDCTSEQVMNDVSDVRATAVPIQVTVGGTNAVSGTILFYPGDAPIIDVDWYRLSYFNLALNGVYRSTVELRYLTGFGELELISPDGLLTLETTTTVGAETVKRYVTQPMLGAAQLDVRVAGVTTTDDNLYRLTVSQDPPIFTRPDIYDRPTPNNLLANATVIAPGALPDGVAAAADGVDITVTAATINTTADRDIFRVEGFDFPQGSVPHGVVYAVDAGTDDVEIVLRTLAGGLIGSGRGSVGAVWPQGEPFTVEVTSRYPGLFASYGLRMKVSPETLDPDILVPGPTIVELAKFIDLMETRKPFGPRPPEVGCLACNLLGKRGALEPVKTAQPSGGMAPVTKFITVRTPSRLAVRSQTPIRQGGVKLISQDMNEVRGQVERNGLSFDLAPGPHALQWRPTGDRPRLEYQVRQRR